jgi:hypothetical protein
VPGLHISYLFEPALLRSGSVRNAFRSLRDEPFVPVYRNTVRDWDGVPTVDDHPRGRPGGTTVVSEEADPSWLGEVGLGLGRRIEACIGKPT